MTTNNLPQITIGIAIKNESKYIEACLSSILELDYPKELITVLVADGRSTDNTRELVKKFPGVVLLDNEKENAAAGRNLLVENCKTELIAFTDGDCEVDKNWILKLVQTIQKHPGAACVGGPNIAFEDDPELARLVAHIQNSAMGSGGSTQGFEYQSIKKVDSIPNCNALYQKEWIEKVGGYDLYFKIGQDGEMNYRISEEGGLFYYNPEAFVKHHRRATLKTFSRRMFLYGFAMGKIFKKHKKIVRWYAPIPTLLIIISVFMWLLGLWKIWIVLFALYLLLNFYLTIKILFRNKTAYALLTPLLYNLQIVFYGIGFGWALLTKQGEKFPY